MTRRATARVLVELTPGWVKVQSRRSVSSGKRVPQQHLVEEALRK
jgi:hypothetical protein